MKNLMKPVVREIMDNSLDIYEPKSVEVIQSEDNSRLWVNVDGVCLLRIGGIPPKKEFATVGTVTGRVSCDKPNMEEMPREESEDFKRIRKALLDAYCGPAIHFGMDFGMGEDITAVFASMFTPPKKKKTFFIGKTEANTRTKAPRYGLDPLSHADQLIGAEGALVVAEEGWDSRPEYAVFFRRIERFRVRCIPLTTYLEIRRGER